MQLFKLFGSLLLAFTIQLNTNAQIIKKVTDVGNTINSANSTVTSTSGSITNAKNTLKTLLGGGKTKDANIFAIAGIEYENEDLELLKNAIKSVKNVKDVVTNYKDGTVTITIKSKSNATEIWDKIPQNQKLKFKLLQSDEKSVILEYKASSTNVTSINGAEEKTGNGSIAANKKTAQPASGNNSSQAVNNAATTDTSSSKAAYFLQYDFEDRHVNFESETLEKGTCSATIGATGKVLTVNLFNKESQTGISFELTDFYKLTASKYEFDSEKTNKEKATYQNGTNMRQMHISFAPGDGKLYKIQCALDPVFNYQGSGYLNLIKIKPVKGGVVEGEFQFSFPVYKIKNGPAEIHQIKSGKFRIAIQSVI